MPLQLLSPHLRVSLGKAFILFCAIASAGMLTAGLLPEVFSSTAIVRQRPEADIERDTLLAHARDPGSDLHLDWWLKDLGELHSSSEVAPSQSNQDPAKIPEQIARALKRIRINSARPENSISKFRLKGARKALLPDWLTTLLRHLSPRQKRLIQTPREERISFLRTELRETLDSIKLRELKLREQESSTDWDAYTLLGNQLETLRSLLADSAAELTTLGVRLENLDQIKSIDGQSRKLQAEKATLQNKLAAAGKILGTQTPKNNRAPGST